MPARDITSSLVNLLLTKLLSISLIILAFAVVSYGQVPVSVGPEPRTQFLDNAGLPLSGGIVCTYSAGSSTPLGTYTDSSGSVLNSNPIVLASDGRANIWWQAQAYKVVLAGGGTCASPSNLQWTVDNFSVGVFLSGNNTWSGTNTFNGATIFNGSVTINNGGTFNGTFAGNPNFSGTVTFSGTLSVSQMSLTVATGTPPLVVTSTTLVPNLNIQLVNGVSFPASPSLHSAPIITASNVASWKVIPDCTGTAGSLQFTQSTNAFACNAPTPGAVDCPVTKSGYSLNFTGGVWSCNEVIPPVLKKGSNGGNYVAATGSFAAVDGTNLKDIVTIPTGSNLVVTANGVMSPTGGTSTWYIALFDGGSKLTEEALSWTAAGASNACPGTMNCGNQNFSLSYLIAGDGASHTIQLEYAVEGASNDTTGRILNSSGIFPTMVLILQ